MLHSPEPDGLADCGPADFTLAVHPDRNGVVVAPSGDMDLTTVGGVEREIVALREAGFDDIVLDLHTVTFIDSSGLHLLLSETRKAAHDGYRFRLIGTPPAARRLFEITGTCEVFEFVEGPAT